MFKKICIIVLLFFLFCCAYSSPPLFSEEQNSLINPFKVTSMKNSEGAPTSTLVEFETERGVNLKYVLLTPESYYAIAILLPGGTGTLNISDSTEGFVIGAQEDFMVRNRNYFAENGLLVVLLDAPSDMQPGGMTPHFRVSEEHTRDIFDVITRVREQSDMPVWLLGISMATYSASSNAIQLKDDMQGLVLASSSTQPTSEGNGVIPYPNGILDLELENIIAPTLILAHEDDECPGTPPTGAVKIKDELTSAPSVEIKYFTGGNEPESGSCGPLSPHCFYGIDTEVVSAIANFIMTSPLTSTTSVTSTIAS